MAVLFRRRRTLDFWPGFVDALAALLMVMVFVILIFVIGQFVLTDAVGGRDRALARLQSELATLTHSLSMETAARESAQARLEELQASLRQAQLERDTALITAEDAEARLHTTQRELDETQERAAQLVADISALERLKAELEDEVARLAGQLDDTEHALAEQTTLSNRSVAQIELLNRQFAAVREQLEQLNRALAAAEAEIAERDIEIEELGQQLNIALAQRVQELDRFRSEFFGRLRDALGEREDIEIVGDRFVFSSEVLFPSASDEVTEDGLDQLDQLADTLLEIAEDIPDDLPWVLQVDGHTDQRPIATARFPSNWELSTARAVSIVKYLADQGIPPERLAAAGHGEFHPIDPRDTAAAHERNRRIELKLTSR